MTMTHGGQRLPDSWGDRIRAMAQGLITPVTARQAATVLLLRDTPADGPEVHMLRRRTSMAFAAGMYAYPGGGVDPRDERPVGWAGPSPAVWAERLGLDRPDAAQAVVCAAVRETFEEAGVLLAGPDASSVVADTTGDAWEADRRALVAHELSFADLLARRDLVLRSDLLGPWARWTTPEFEERRYDTWFFVAALPDGQLTRDVSGEADHTVWTSPTAAAAAHDAGELLMMPPTLATLRALTPRADVADVLAASAGRDMTAVLARLETTGEEIVVSWPGHEEFTLRVPRHAPSAEGTG
ncbi:NUDIX hydrolase [Streptantibioticus silvisoli]|uniref:NUDIX hydrolase n=1 Tax=Streptantibioticus silvisoli TaxID=2705255 RepID=A0ABT6VYZ6_9ACTN|nr:NUDIX hydrolase [Streptantibioticus silvisoli]MDI5962972.1 NUDIX hydrolase [Streptantibioticus silvisoli]